MQFRGSVCIPFWFCLILVAWFGAQPCFAEPSAIDRGPMREWIERYAEDRGALERYYDAPISDARDARMRAFDEQELRGLAALDFEKLDQACRIDYLLLKGKLEFDLKQLEHQRRQAEEVAGMLPFAPAIVALEESRQRMEKIDPERSAQAIDKITAGRRAAERRPPPIRMQTTARRCLPFVPPTSPIASGGRYSAGMLSMTDSTRSFPGGCASPTPRRTGRWPIMRRSCAGARLAGAIIPATTTTDRWWAIRLAARR
jgi:hypothetical protein